MKTTLCRECGRTLMGEICMTCCSDVVLANSTRELDRLRAENARLRRFVADQGRTCWPCEKCGHATSGKCLHCEVSVLRDVLSRIRQWDHLDTASDGAYWKAEIDKVLGAWGEPKEGAE